MFGNPVLGTIRPLGSPVIVGNFRVTAAFGQTDADHLTPHGGVDIGNGRCNDPIIACADGTVSLAGLIGPAKVVRIVHPQYPGYESGYAHLATIEVAKGQVVKRGQRLGTLGTTGANACHLHLGLKLNGISVDAWPLLDQNQEGEVLLGTDPKRVTNRSCETRAATNFRADPSTAKPALALIPAATVFAPDFEVAGQVVVGSTRWLSGMLPVNGVLTRGYFHASTLTPLQPIEKADCTDEVTAATAPLNARISAAKLALG